MSDDEGPLGFLRRKLREACADGAADAWTLRKRITDVLHDPQWEDAALAAQAVRECKDNDSPWLVCKPCNAAGRCAKKLKLQTPLTDEQMDRARIDAGIAASNMMWDILKIYGRAVERAHGIK